MSNVIHASIDYSGPDKQAVVGKIYEDLYKASNGTVSVRYIRLIKAKVAITAGDLCQFVATDSLEAYIEGLGGPVAADATLKPYVAGVAVANIAANEFGFVVCRGVVEGVKAAAGINVGDLLKSTSTVGGGEVGTATVAAGTSLSVLGVALTPTASSAINAYIDVL